MAFGDIKLFGICQDPFACFGLGVLDGHLERIDLVKCQRI